MKYLLPGHEPLELIEIYFSLTKINSEETKSAIVDHLVKGFREKDAVALNGATQSNFNRSLARINEIAGLFERAKEIQLSDIKRK